MKLQKGETVYTILRHVSRSRIFRVIDAYVIRHNEPIHITVLMTNKQEKKFRELYEYDSDKSGFKTYGTGMDMGFELVYNLSRVCFPHGFIVSDKTIHRNGALNETRDKDGGYALKQSWI